MSSMNIVNIMNIVQGYQGGKSNFYLCCSQGTFMMFTMFMKPFWGYFWVLGHDLGLIFVVKTCVRLAISQNHYTFP